MLRRVSIRERIVGPCYHRDAATKEFAIDGDDFLERLLLFECCTLESPALLELPSLVDLLGYKGVVELLESNSFYLHHHRMLPGSFERESPGGEGWRVRYSFDDGAPTTEPMTYRIYGAVEGKPNEELDRAEIGATLPLDRERAESLLDAIEPRLVRIPSNFGNQATAQTSLEVGRDSGALRRSLARELSRRLKADVAPNDLELGVRLDPDGDIRPGDPTIRVESNLTTRFGLSEDAAHRLVGSSLLALGRLNGRIETMELCSGVSGMEPGEEEFMSSKLEFLAREVSPEVQHENFERLLTLLDLPRLGAAVRDGTLDSRRFLKVRNSDECREFRRWLRDLDEVGDEEIVERVTSLRARLGVKLQSGPGRFARFILTSGIGAIPVVGQIAGFAAGGLDTFLIDKLLPSSGPAVFLNRSYPSMFAAS